LLVGHPFLSLLFKGFSQLCVLYVLKAISHRNLKKVLTNKYTSSSSLMLLFLRFGVGAKSFTPEIGGMKPVTNNP
jgi:hypothetical protein